MTQRSSTQRATCGNSSLTSIPLLPYLANLNGEGSSLPPPLPRLVPSFVSPLYFASAGLGSNVSTCEGPPFINRKMTRLARGVKWGALGASGLLAPLVAACSEEPSNPSPASTLAKPRAPKPLPRLHSICRRFIRGCMTDAPWSFSPLPCTRGRGVGGEGETLPPHPQPLSPSTGERGGSINRQK